LVEEENYFSIKYWEAFKYSTQTKKNETLKVQKRKQEQITKSPKKLSLFVPRQELTLASASTSTEIHFQSKQFKSSTSTKEIPLDSNKILIRLSSPQRTNFVRIPWI